MLITVPPSAGQSADVVLVSSGQQNGVSPFSRGQSGAVWMDEIVYRERAAHLSPLNVI